MAELLTISDLCERLPATEYRIRADVAAGLLPHRKLGRAIRFTRDDVQVYLDRIAVDAGGRDSGQTEASRRRSRRIA